VFEELPSSEYQESLFTRRYKIFGVKRERGVILLGRFWQIQSQRKGGHTPCPVICGRQLFVMYVERSRKSMHLSGRETIGQQLGRHSRGFWKMELTGSWSSI
jgi:hypothetical protein